MVLLALLVSPGLGRAQAPPWAEGREVAQVSLEAPEGGLPRENLEPLLAMHQGDLLSPTLVRQDLTMLFRVGQFASVEAVVEPWFTFDAEGQVQDAVSLTYRVYPPPRVRSIEVSGARGAARTVALKALGLDRGGPFYPDQEAEGATARVQRALRDAGWRRARVAPLEVESDEAGLRVRVSVELGSATRLNRVVLNGDPVLNARQARRWLRPLGVVPGRRVTASAADASRAAIRDHLVDRGWLDAVVKVGVKIDPADHRSADLGVLVDAGPRLTLHTRGRGLPGDAELREILGLVAGERLGRASVSDLEERLRTWFTNRGRFEAQVHIAYAEQASEVHLDIEARRGRRHTLGKVEASGALTFNARYLAGALREAAPETLGRGIVTREAVESALDTVQAFYRSQGFLDASLSLVSLTPGRPRLGQVPLQLLLAVVEGPRTTLTALSAEGGILPEDDGLSIEAPAVHRAAEALIGKPYDPASLDAVAREIADAYRRAGYLNVDVRAEATLTPVDAASGRAEGRLRIVPGQQLRLRSVIIQGNRRTRRQVIARELQLDVGAPVSPLAIEQGRNALYALDLFRSVSPALVGDDDRSRDLVVTVDEKPNILTELGGGVSTDQGLAARARVSHRNLAGLGQRLSALGQVGIGWAGDDWTLDAAEPTWRAALRYEAPYVPARGYRLIAELLLQEAVQEPSWRLVRSGASVGVQGRWGERTEAILDYHYQFRKLEDADPGVFVSGEPWWPVSGGALDDLPDTPTEVRRQGGTGLTVVYDARDDRFNPRRGSLITLAAEAGDPLSASPAFLKALGRVEQLIPIGPLILDLSGRGGIGWVAGTHTTLAVEDRFTLGGSGSLRGFKRDTVGPANRVGRPNVDYPSQIDPLVNATSLESTPTHWVPTGGDALAVLSAELRIPLVVFGLDFQTTSLVFFADVGRVGFLDPTVYTTSGQEGLDRALRAGVGPGLHLATPIGPAAVDLGINVDPISAYEEPRFVVHLTLGAL